MIELRRINDARVRETILLHSTNEIVQHLYVPFSNFHLCFYLVGVSDHFCPNDIMINGPTTVWKHLNL
jgi:hypothetical protein